MRNYSKSDSKYFWKQPDPRVWNSETGKGFYPGILTAAKTENLKSGNTTGFCNVGFTQQFSDL